MFTLGSSQKPVVMPHYPHMMADDTEVWTKFLQTTRVKIVEVWYDVHVGQSNVSNMDVDALTQRISRGVTRKRIDVVAKVGAGYWVIEVKPVASMFALGQIITYYRRFVAEYDVKGEVWPVIVCDSYDLDIVDDCEDLNIVLIQND